MVSFFLNAGHVSSKLILLTGGTPETNSKHKPTKIMNDQEYTLFIANEIARQLGGSRRLAMMAGAKDFFSLGEGEDYRGGLQFALKPCKFKKSGINKIRIYLNFSDTYTVEFLKVTVPGVRKGKFHDGSVKTVCKVSDIYCDQLMDLFEEQTGLFLTLSAR